MEKQKIKNKTEKTKRPVEGQEGEPILIDRERKKNIREREKFKEQEEEK